MLSQRTAGWIDHLARDVRYACRALLRNRGFTAAVVITLALGIGANTAIFSVVHAVLIKPLPYAQPDRIYSAEVVIPARRAQFQSLPVSVQVFLEWRRATPPAIESFAALRPWECNLVGDGDPEARRRRSRLGELLRISRRADRARPRFRGRR
jgi:hypothetical protein